MTSPLRLRLGRTLLWTLALVAFARAATTEEFFWSSPNLGAGLAVLPAGWQMTDHSENSAVLSKPFTTDVLAFTERMTFQVARDTSDGLDNTLQALRDEGYRLVRERRVGNDDVSVPFWLLSGPADEESACWIAVLLHSGKVYTLTLQCSTLDDDAPQAFDQVLGGFRLISDPRETAWSAYTRGDYETAERSFSQILHLDHDDANARYGRGLAELARHELGDAIDDLKRAEAPLRSVEDVRRALGQAELERGHTARAVALWAQVIDDQPDWEAEVGPWIEQAIQAETDRHGNAASNSSTSELAKRLTIIAEQFLAHLRTGDTWAFFELQTAFQHTRDELLAACLDGRGSGLDLAILHASCSWARGIRQGMTGSNDGDETQINEAQYLLAQPFRNLRLPP